MTISVTVDDDGLKRKTARFQARYEALQTTKIEHWLTVLRDKVRMTNAFTNPTNNLQLHVWAGKAQRIGKTIIGSGGWGDYYGPILEFGVTQAKQGGWPIKPKKKGGRLRFQKGSSIIYSTGVWHPWKYGDKGSRPHWEPELNAMRSDIEADLGKSVQEAML